MAKIMKTFAMIRTTLLFVAPLLAALVFALPVPTEVTPNDEEDSAATHSYDFSDPFLKYMPPLSQGDELGPHNEDEKKRSEGILERLNEYRRTSSFNDTYWNRKTVEPSSTLLDNATTSDGLSIPITSKISDMMQNLYNATEISVTDKNSSNNNVDYNSSNTMLPQTVTQNTSNNITVSQTVLLTNNTTETPAVATASPSPRVYSSTKPPKMPETTSSSIIIPSFKYSPIPANATSPPNHRRRAARHPIVFLLLPFLIAGGVAVLILFGSYLRKKIRLDKLRHQLMPLYSFDPAEGEDWETELLTEPRPASGLQPSTVTTAIKGSSSGSPVPKLCFTPETGEV